MRRDHLGACALLKEKAPVRKTTKRTKKGPPSRVALGIGGGGGNRTRVRRHSIPGTTCLAHRWISFPDSTVCEAHRGPACEFNRGRQAAAAAGSRDDDPTSTSTGTGGFGAYALSGESVVVVVGN